MSDEHKRGLEKNQFCGIPKDGKCKCGNDYIEICKPGWHDFTFKRLVRRKALPVFVFGKKYEAHHILCVACVAGQIIAKDSIDSVIAQTKWCINNKKNMMALPLWGHTVRWYCSEKLGEEENPGRPDFQDLPQHDWDHNSKKGYTWEIETELKDIAKVIEDAGHEVEPDDIAAALNNLSMTYERNLKSRGARRGGTHRAWLSGGDEQEWYEPFSMASTGNLTAKGFPAKSFDSRVAAWIKRLAEALAG